MKHIWIADLCLAGLTPLLAAPALNFVASLFASPDPFMGDQYFVAVDTAGWLPLTVAFCAAALWSWSRPRHALLAQILPMSVVLTGLMIVAAVYLDLVKH